MAWRIVNYLRAVRETYHHLTEYDRVQTSDPDAVAIVIVAHGHYALTRLALDAIAALTPESHETWVVDNASPPGPAAAVFQDHSVNLLVNHTAPWLNSRPVDGSRANGTALELAASVLRGRPPRWWFVMHNDAAPMRRGWLPYVRGKTSERVRGVGMYATRPDVMHQSGFLIDAGVVDAGDFLPNMPDWDAGDRVSLRLGSDRVAMCPNALSEPARRETVPVTFRGGDLAFDDDGRLLYAHLGGGTIGAGSRRVSEQEWISASRAWLARQ
jgi:hypothetical protein